MLPLLEYIDHPRFHCNFISASDLIKFILTFSSVILKSIGSMKLLEDLYITFFNDNNYRQLVSSFTTDNQTLMVTFMQTHQSQKLVHTFWKFISYFVIFQ